MIVKVPLVNAMGKTDGCEKAPDAIVKEMKDVYSSENGKEILVDELEIANVEVNLSNLEEANQDVFGNAKAFLSNPSLPVLFLGGDHSISYPLVKAFQSVNNNPGLIVFDAHADCVNSFKPPTHEDWLRVLIEEGFPQENIILVGLRNVYKNKNEKEVFDKINVFSNKEIFEDIHRACDGIMTAANKFDSLYVSVDIDVVDPAFAPAVAHQAPGGLTSRELIYLLQRIKLLKNLKAADIVEINPDRDAQMLTTKLGAKVAVELLG